MDYGLLLLAPLKWCLLFLCQFIRPPHFSVTMFGERLQYAYNCHEVHNPTLFSTVCCCFSNTAEEEPSAAVAPGASGSNTASQSWDRRESEHFCLLFVHARKAAGLLSYEQCQRSAVTCCLLFYPACLSVSRLKWKDRDKGLECSVCCVKTTCCDYAAGKTQALSLQPCRNSAVIMSLNV